MFPNKHRVHRGDWHDVAVQKNHHAKRRGSSRVSAGLNSAKSIAEPSIQDTALLLDIHQLAKTLNVGRTTVEKWTKTRRIPSLKLGRVLRYDLKKVMAALEAYERKAL